MPESLKQSEIREKKNKQNRRLNSKLKERLGHSNIYSQRNSRKFFEKLSPQKQEKILKEFKILYYEILTDYFNDEENIVQKIDRFVEVAFFVNLSLGKVVEIHLELIEELSRKLHIEGIPPDFLSDYRLVLIDVIAHLGEMYRSVVSEKCVTVPEQINPKLG